jgi:hypothetical protein
METQIESNRRRVTVARFIIISIRRRVTDARTQSQRLSAYQFIAESVFRYAEQLSPQVGFTVGFTMETAPQLEEKIEVSVLMYLYGCIMSRYGSRGKPLEDG